MIDDKSGRFTAVLALINAMKQETEAAAITPRSLGVILDEIVALVYDAMAGKIIVVEGSQATEEPSTPVPPNPVDAEQEENTTTEEITTEEVTTEELTTPEPDFVDGFMVIKTSKPIYNIYLNGNLDVIQPVYFVENDEIHINVAPDVYDFLEIKVTYTDGSTDTWVYPTMSLVTREPLLVTTTEEWTAEPTEEMTTEELTAEPTEYLTTEQWWTEEQTEEMTTEEYTEEPTEELTTEEWTEEPTEEMTTEAPTTIAP